MNNRYLEKIAEQASEAGISLPKATITGALLGGGSNAALTRYSLRDAVLAKEKPLTAIFMKSIRPILVAASGVKGGVVGSAVGLGTAAGVNAYRKHSSKS